MSLYIDRKYLSLISSRLRNFKEKFEDLYNFSCPFCGDSQKNRSKARGYIFRKNNSYLYRCHNCSISTNFAKMLQFMDAEKFKEYCIENFMYKNPSITEIVKTPKKVVSTDNKKLSDFSKFSVENLPEGHVARMYVKNRLIPQEFWNELFFTENYSTWMDENFPDHGKKNLPQDARIFMFFTNQKKEVVQVAGRALVVTDDRMRYITVNVLKEERKVFGIHRMNPEKRVYVVEGQFDSLFLPNAVASGDSNLMGLGEYLYKACGCEDVVLVYDVQPRNKELISLIDKAIKNGYKVALLPYSEESKDINEMIRGGMSSEDVKCLIDNSVYFGMRAKLEFSKWRKC